MVRYRLVCLVSLILLALVIFPMEGLAAEEPSGKNQPGSNAQQTQNPSGSVTMELGQGAFIFSALAGKGVLTYQGQSYNLKIGGVGIGGIGASMASVTGEVYNLAKLEDFSGAYLQLEGGHAAVEGAGVLWLRNAHGVKLELRSKTKGLMMTAAGEGVVIHLENPKK